MSVPDEIAHQPPGEPPEPIPGPGALSRRFTTERRLLVVVPFAAIVGVVTGVFAPWGVAVLLGWVVLAATLVAWTWFAVAPLDARTTAAVATSEDEGRFAAELLLLSASVVSLIGTAFDFLRAGNEQGAAKVGLVALGVGTVAASWALVHTIFTLRYAHLYYTPPIGGLDFKSDDAPAYGDFAYMAFTVGMTFQVSDTDVRSPAIRRAVLRHALLSYLFGAVILASMVNIVADIAR